MKKLVRLFLAGLLALSAPVGFASIGYAQTGPINSIYCNQSAPWTGTGAAAIVIAGAAGVNINVCGWQITNTAATGTFNIQFGSGAGCGTNTVNVTGTLSVTSTAPVTDHTDHAFLSASPGNGVCVNATVTTVTGVLWFSKT